MGERGLCTELSGARTSPKGEVRESKHVVEHLVEHVVEPVANSIGPCGRPHGRHLWLTAWRWEAI
jgi:predicted urease superfamily metal-dependent hydrolase